MSIDWRILFNAGMIKLLKRTSKDTTEIQNLYTQWIYFQSGNLDIETDWPQKLGQQSISSISSIYAVRISELLMNWYSFFRLFWNILIKNLLIQIYFVCIYHIFKLIEIKRQFTSTMLTYFCYLKQCHKLC